MLRRDDGPLAVVYRGPASLPGCPESVADLLRMSRWGFTVRYVGPKERLPLTATSLRGASLYAQPGGGELKPAWRRMRRHAGEITDFVAAGGRYLGFCLGAYLAGESPGFRLIPGDADQYIRSRGAGTTTDAETVIRVNWGGALRDLYFEDGPYIDLDPSRGRADVLATYDNHLPAAVVAPYGSGTIGLVGPHPEATSDWFMDAGLRPPARLALDLGLDLVDRVMSG